ncbi:two-component system sensor kinase [[Actinomadura] parvosata subsp. kistnae]|uniref:histidine kinase n=1 Tax=[Actinomadura] parvosata subsp. kistnae TaxID=1909395 RepID=A0A1V0AIY1_9ACTN|nr:two-component sensor histidine kinase [Nonomuraea sp. ATCC 55076]SPL87450.1 two-component system sensor kinase [Actinomadura parvosata subsp. kistnae]
MLAGVVAAASVALFALYGPDRLQAEGIPVEGVRPPDLLGALLLVVASVPVVVRRRWPLAGLCAGMVPETLLTVLGYGLGMSGLAGLVLLFSVASYRGLAVALAGLVLSLVTYVAGIVSSPIRAGTVSEYVVTAVVLVAVWGAGRSLRLRRAYLEELKDRAARLERAHAADTRAARAEERSRIARELHDVVAHHVSVMTVQAAAARRVLAADPDLAREALSAIEHTGRLAMTEMRNIVGVLRTDTRAELGPQPGVRDLPALVEQMREAGLPTRLRVEGAPVPLPAGVDLAAYRLVQEGLTNSLRHAGAGAEAVVTVRYEPYELDVRVRDDGKGAVTQGGKGAAAQAGKGAGPQDGKGGAAQDGPPATAGHGLVGIRERVALYGGILNIGPLPGGGFEVRARLPLKDGQ